MQATAVVLQPRAEGLRVDPRGRVQLLGAPPATPPTVSGQTPPSGSSIPPGQLVQFTLAGLYGLFVLYVEYPSGSTEVVWNGTTFTSRFVSGSTMAGSSASRQVALSRKGGWPEAPTLQVVTPGGTDVTGVVVLGG